MKKICFIPPLQKATLSGIKNQTRRIIRIEDCSHKHKALEGKADWWNEPMVLGQNNYSEELKEYWQCNFCGHPLSISNLKGIKPRFSVGEIVAIAQPYKDIISSIPFKEDEILELQKSIGWKNKLYVKPSLMPYQIQITAVRAERLQDISNEDCIREGIKETNCIAEDNYNPVYENGYNSTKKKNGTLIIQYDTPREAYAALIDVINGKGTWDSNPYMWVYDYRLHKISIKQEL